MKDMLRPAIENKARLGKVGFSSEIDTIGAIKEARIRARESNWIPGTPSMSDDDHLEVIRELKSEINHSINYIDSIENHKND